MNGLLSMIGMQRHKIGVTMIDDKKIENAAFEYGEYSAYF